MLSTTAIIGLIIVIFISFKDAFSKRKVYYIKRKRESSRKSA